MASHEVKVPDIGNYTDIPVIEVLVKPGDTVAKDQGLVTLESDKATMEVPSSVAGVVKELKVKLGDEISEGTVVAIIEAEAGGESAKKAEAPKKAEEPKKAPSAEKPAGTEPPPAPSGHPLPAGEGGKATIDTSQPSRLSEIETAALAPDIDPEASGPRTPPVTFGADTVMPDKVPHASPAVRLFARELGVDLSKVTGSARAGRITREDVQNFVKRALSAGPARAAVSGGGGGLDLLPWPQVDFGKFGEIEAKPLSKIKKISGANLARNWVMIPHVTQFDDADITDLEALRVSLNKENEKAGIKLTMLAFLIKAVVAALKKYPDFNASLDAGGENLILKKYFHIGFAADTPNGLVVPVIRDADRKGVIEIAQETGELAKKARDGKLGPADMSGGCFSISSLGGIGGTAFTPIVNAPEVAILGVSKSATKPVWDGKAFQPRLILPLSLSYDHRVIDGASAARFTTYLGQVLADMRRVLL
ncbi:pyruvate dehydrogenase E2 component (dihydrolipoamide acetyltransferase) [Dokdonella immobilis]|uniref:Dihydrolipoamide acetyltransferase component of pyruvate dehydrogenase complex n=1 Tax=Dokdonella immobilis TaxID=578942 RepID=A0A1I4Y8S5_9GAMM|nr:dihydrolipoyllysine-residue acetyltransferase [Dokdonella immobilis]SFN33979.1 pyruvate dehydrogenase E2 component (dihydrolipoamide acetyltransferase) [Dokdonella immobilis]